MMKYINQTVVLITLAVTFDKFSTVVVSAEETGLDNDNHFCFTFLAESLIKTIEDFKPAIRQMKETTPLDYVNIPSLKYKSEVCDFRDAETLGTKLVGALNNALNDLDLDTNSKQTGRDAIINFCKNVYTDDVKCTYFKLEEKNIGGVAQLKTVYTDKLGGDAPESLEVFTSNCG